jgi:hypothetical protein
VLGPHLVAEGDEVPVGAAVTRIMDHQTDPAVGADYSSVLVRAVDEILGTHKVPGLARAFPGGLKATCSMTGQGAARDCRAYLGPRALAAPGDMMMDWVSSRLRGDAAAQSMQAVRLALRGRTGSG